MLEAFIRGAGLGLATCLTFGPVTVTVMRAGFERRWFAAILCGAGAALVDGAESYLAYLGIAELLQQVPGAIPVLYLAAGAVLIGSAIRASKKRTEAPQSVNLSAGARAFSQGLLMTALNPAPLLGWIALAGALFADLTPLSAGVASSGVFMGVLAWFVLVTVLAIRGRSLFGAKAFLVTRALDVVIGFAGVYLVVRGALHVFKPR